METHIGGELKHVPVLKLHGSVDWARKGAGIVCEDRAKLLRSAGDEPFIAAPGRSKQESVKELERLWVQARQALSEADTLVVLDYGFPKTDAQARTEIQRAFAGGTSNSEVRRVHFLLGPDTNGSEARRVHALLEANGGRKGIVWFLQKTQIANRGLEHIFYLTAHPLWVEDFIFDYAHPTLGRSRVSPFSAQRVAGRGSGGMCVRRGRKELLLGPSAGRGCQATIESIMDGRLEITLPVQNNGARPEMDVPRCAHVPPQRLATAFRRAPADPANSGSVTPDHAQGQLGDGGAAVGADTCRSQRDTLATHEQRKQQSGSLGASPDLCGRGADHSHRDAHLGARADASQGPLD